MYQRFRQHSRRAPRAPAGIVAAVSAAGVAAHSAAAVAGPAGTMSWLMTGMAAVCLVAAIPVGGGRFCAGRSAGHLLAMNAGMVLVHLVLLTAPPTHAHQVNAGASEGSGLSGHEYGMLTLMAFELLCLAAASAALRLSRLAVLEVSNPWVESVGEDSRGVPKRFTDPGAGSRIVM